MARKKKSTKGRKKKVEAVKDVSPNTVSYFWRQVFAVGIIVLALFISLGGLNMGGALPIWLFSASAWLIGFAAFIFPFVLIFLAVHKLRHEEFMIPFGILASSLLFLSAIAGMLHVFLDRTESGSAASNGTYGGHVGNLLSGAALSFFNEITAFIIFVFLTWLAFMLMFGLTPKVLFDKFKNLFIKESDSEEAAEASDIKPGFKVKESVPVLSAKEISEKDKLSSGPRHASFKNTIAPLTAKERHEALITASDPNWKSPPLSLLSSKQDKADPGDVKGNVERIRQAMSNFGMEVEMEGANIGPRVTQYTLKTPDGVRMNKILGLSDNIAYELEATSVRIEAPIPGKKAVGIEVPNRTSASVTIRGMLNNPKWQKIAKSPLAFAVGLDIAGEPVYLDLAEMPHMLVAGQTKAGKSVMINTFLTSLLYNNSPSDLKLILVDPKFVEMAPYNDIPHLLTPVVNDPEKCISALKWAVAEMERRYRSLQAQGVRNIDEYNDLNQDESMPQIVIVIDELSDLMQMAARDVEALIVRIAQKSRAVGIHLVLATQRPSVDVITGLIKANVPARFAFTVASQIDSRTIIDQAGAEKLLGKGDLLLTTADLPKPKRVQGALITTEETKKVTEYLRDQQPPQYDDEVVSMPVQFNGKGGLVPDTSKTSHGGDNGDDEMFKDAVQVVIDSKKASTSLLQRRLKVGYGRASRMIDEMEERGIIGPADGSRPREVLVRSLEEVFSDGQMDGEGDDARQIEVDEDPRDEYLTR
jgi:DNA segregation ATPase FtsK/SpoIIIE, S-DNA-T family